MIFLPWHVSSLIFSDVSNAISSLMWADERGVTLTILDNVYNAMYLGMLCVLLLANDWIGIEKPSLRHLGILYFILSILYNIMIIGLVMYKGWLTRYKNGLFYNLSLMNTKLVKSILQMSFPLTLGVIVSTFQWEILTVFAAHMGSPEVAAWTLLGSIWNVFEYFPGGFTTAAGICVTWHLGKGNPGMAKISAYKCMLYSTLSTTIISVIFVSLRDTIVTFYTDVTVIQDMLGDLILMVGIANVVMVVGVVAYSILCAQGRTNIATGTYVVLSFVTTLPLCVFFVYVKGYDLQSLVFALIVGYCLSSLVLMVFLLTSNWASYSKAVIRKSQKSKEAQDRLDERRSRRNKNEATIEADGIGMDYTSMRELL
jgi:Na+-driven multidrug efflux pump